MATAAPFNHKPVPRQVQERFNRANALLESQNAKDAPPEETPNAAAQPGRDAPSETQQAPAEDTPQNPAAGRELAPFRDPALADDPRANDPLYWRNRFSVLQGRMQQERRLAEQREATLREQIEAAQRELKALKTGQEPAVDVKALFTSEQLEALGEEHAAAIAAASVKAANKQVNTALEEQRAHAESLRAQEAEKAQARMQRDFYDALEERIPNFREIDARQDWREWLAESDPLTGTVRQDLLMNAANAGDAERTAQIFRAFSQTKSPRPTPQMAPASDAGKAAAAPAASGRDASLTKPTSAEMNDFYKRAALNKVSEAERVEFEKRLALLYS